jgi:hypothetical protein
MSRIVHFDIQADDLERAKALYSTVLGWNFESWRSWTTGSMRLGQRAGGSVSGGIAVRPTGVEIPAEVGEVPAEAAAR